MISLSVLTLFDNTTKANENELAKCAYRRFRRYVISSKILEIPNLLLFVAYKERMREFVDFFS